MKQIKSITGKILFEVKKEKSAKELSAIVLLEQAVRQNTDLTYSNLMGCELEGSDLRSCDLRGCELGDSNLRGADLRSCDLWGCELACADLKGTDLERANLKNSNLRGCDLRGADLTYSNLIGCELEGADLRNADLRNADLRNADLRNADLEINKIKHLFQIVPEEGSFVAWKKGENSCILKLLISTPKRHNYLAGRKCRAECVDVLNIWDSKGNEIKECQNEPYRTRVQYTAGKRTYADSYNPDPRIECSNGIHFFLTRKEAEEW